MNLQYIIERIQAFDRNETVDQMAAKRAFRYFDLCSYSEVEPNETYQIYYAYKLDADEGPIE